MATHPPAAAGTSPQQELVDEQEEEQAQRADNNQVIAPEDGYEWKKYGQKYIKNVRRNRSYFKCRNKGCKAKKRVDWSPANPSSVRVVYDGVHDHQSPLPQSASSQEAAASMTNQYNLANQVFGSAAEINTRYPRRVLRRGA